MYTPSSRPFPSLIPRSTNNQSGPETATALEVGMIDSLTLLILTLVALKADQTTPSGLVRMLRRTADRAHSALGRSGCYQNQNHHP